MWVAFSAYAGRYSLLQPRVTKPRVHAVVDLGRPLPIQYGATVVLATMGGLLLERLLLPQVPSRAALSWRSWRSPQPMRRCFPEEGTAAVEAGGGRCSHR